MPNLDDNSESFGQRRTSGSAGSAWDFVNSNLGITPDGEPAPAAAAKPAPKVDDEESEGRGVVEDIAVGATQAPRAIAHGTIDAFNEMGDLVTEAADWVTNKLGLDNTGGVSIGADGVKFISGDELKAMRAAGNGLADQRIPNVAEPDTVTGGIIEGMTQFLAGFGVAGKAMKGFKAATKGQKAGKAAVQGAAADFTVFDPHEERLSNLIETVPELRSPVTEFLAADPTDGAAEGRFKNAIEGLGLGVVAEGAIHGLRVMRAAREAKIKARAQRNDQVNPNEVDLSILGDPEQPGQALVEVKPPEMSLPDDKPDAGGPSKSKAKRKIKAGIDETQGLDPEDLVGDTNKVAGPAAREINFASINAPQDVKRVMQAMAEANANSIDDAARGTRSWAKTKASAAQKNAWDTLLNRRKGEALNSDETLAARQLWLASSQKLTDVATAAAANPSEANLVVFGKMLATHHAIQKEVLAARAEAGRALNAWAIPTGTKNADAKMSQLAELLEANGGTKNVQRLARYISAASAADMPRLVDELVEKGVFAKTGDAIAQVWINGLLSNPATHVVNSMSNLSVAMQAVYERAGAARIAQITGEEGSVQLGEATAMMFGAVEGIKDAFRVSARGRQVLGSAAGSLFKGDLSGAADTIAANADEFGSVYQAAASGKSGIGAGKIDIRPAQGGSLGSEAWNVASDTWAGRGMDLLDHATSAPGRALTTADEFFKTMGYRMELNALALRQANADVRAGTISADQVKNRVAEILADPPDTLKADASAEATYRTFTGKPAELLNRIASAVRDVPILGKLLIPFKNTPINVFTYGFERTPLAPLVKTWRADIAAGGARADVAMARTATGTMIMLAAMDFAMNDRISGGGPQEPGMKAAYRRMGKQPYSVKVGDTWHSYQRADPIGMTMGLASDIVEIMSNADASQEDVERMWQATILAVGANVMSKTYMQGTSDFFDAMSDPDRYGERWFQKMAGSLVPAGVAAIARMEDPYMRSASDMVEAMKRRMPGMSADLPPVRDLWGRPVDYRSGKGAMFDLLSPVYVKRENPEPVDKELDRLGYYPSMPGRQFQLQGVQMDLTTHPALYAEYVRLAGNDAKEPNTGLGAKDYMNDVVANRHPDSDIYWQDTMTDGPDGSRKMFLESRLRMFREAAKLQMLEESDEFRALFELGKRKQEELAR